MSKKIPDIIDNTFSSFAEENFIKKEKENYSDEDFFVLFSTEHFYLRMQTYHREIYLYTYPVFDTDKESSVYNVILFQKGIKTLEWQYFHEIDDLEECYRLQLENIVSFLKLNVTEIKDFYLKDGFAERYDMLRQYVISLSPSTFSTM